MRSWIGGWVVLSVAAGCREDACVIERGDVLSWQWNFNEYVPAGDPQSTAEDSLAVLDCEVIEDDDDGVTMQLELECESGGDDVGPMQLSVSPIPSAVVDALAADTPLSLSYRPGNNCPNGCQAGGGWLALRDATDGALLLGIVDVHRELGPVAELLDPVGVSVEPSACAPVVTSDCSGQDEDGTSQSLDVTVTADAESVVLQAGDATPLGAFDLVLDRAHVGNLGGCTSDGGDPSAVRLMITRRT